MKLAPLVVDTGASVCISPFKSDFATYRPSKVKIKDLSKSNSVAGEGTVTWSVRDTTGKFVSIELPGYHIENAGVRLLSPQVLLGTASDSAQGVIKKADLVLCLDNGVELRANYCPRSNLPLLPIEDSFDRQNLWHAAFHSSEQQVVAFSTKSNVLNKENENLSHAEKELLLWHHRLSHASLSWLQPLMRTKKWLATNDSTNALHIGPFLPCREKKTGTCKLTGVRCAACLAAKASTHTSSFTRHSKSF